MTKAEMNDILKIMHESYSYTMAQTIKLVNAIVYGILKTMNENHTTALSISTFIFL